jgi:hypothetical protein
MKPILTSLPFLSLFTLGCTPDCEQLCSHECTTAQGPFATCYDPCVAACDGAGENGPPNMTEEPTDE